jgi:hypothetical protein
MLVQTPCVDACAHCGGEIEERFRFCPWCAAPLRRKYVEFFHAHPRDAGKMLRVSRYVDEDPHVRFSVWDESGRAVSALSVDEDEAARLAHFLRPQRMGQGSDQGSDPLGLTQLFRRMNRKRPAARGGRWRQASSSAHRGLQGQERAAVRIAQ